MRVCGWCRTETNLKHDEALFRKDKFVLRYLGKIAVILTFGVIFPPLAVVICAAFVSETYLNNFSDRKVSGGDEGSRVVWTHKDQLNRDCVSCLDLLISPLANFLIPFAAFFNGFFVFDSYDGKVGFRKALWAPVLLFVWQSLLTML